MTCGVAVAVHAITGTFGNCCRNHDNLRYAGRKSCPQLKSAFKKVHSEERKKEANQKKKKTN